jgi:RHH-type transcriptional regulator, proline utilization regulon repressor / proline dehydrogenase / delta 1-pyrroline-5-carboxylate dehydrogenase
MNSVTTPVESSGGLTPLLAGRSALRDAITAATRRPEPEAVAELLPLATLPAADATAVHALAQRIAMNLRERKAEGGRSGIVQGLLQEFALSSQEGVALMCLAEALLRIPDAATRDALIRDKISAGNWRAHVGASPSLFVNAAAWGLLLTGKLVGTHSETGLSSALGRLIGKGGEPLIRKGVDMAMRMMGEQFVAGETIADALANAREHEAQGFRYSYDMLGEAAMTAADARRYRDAYESAIHAIGEAAAGRGIYEGPGISIKLSALHPRYSRAQVERVLAELYPELLRLTELAKRYDIGLNIDAEEADRLELSLELLERLCHEPSLGGWNGIGFVIQAYQKRCPAVCDYIVDLARRSKHRLMIRLVKGAYWDSEIKRAQVDGLADYPVYSRKAHTDVSYIACARKLLAAPDAVFPQFATHNAHTLAAIHRLAGQNFYAGQYEFQCLHGMGEALYEQVVGSVADGKVGRPCRIYAPVGTHETLLAYLVRRLLENGANTSFVNRIADPSVGIDQLVMDPAQAVRDAAARDGRVGAPHAAIPLPRQLYGEARANSRGLDLSNEFTLAELAKRLAEGASASWTAAPMLDADAPAGHALATPLLNPADHRDVVGTVREADAAEVQAAIAAADAAFPAWAGTPPAQRAAALLAAADDLEAGMESLIALLVREAGKTCANAVSEVREAVDFLRYYAIQARDTFHNATHVPLGPVVCISPWNFPLAIFSGQVAAALAAGNNVLAKPAEQTPLVAAEAVRALWRAGVPRGALQLLPGRGETVGAALVGDARVRGVMFTGSTEVARLLQRQLAGRIDADDAHAGGRAPVLIAETGGQNAMIVDSSALVEQAVADVIASAFDSAGQRCSALRVLCVQQDAADRVFEMLRDAIGEYRVGNPARLSVDVGPVIDAEARATIERHVQAMRAKGRRVFRQGDAARTPGAATRAEAAASSSIDDAGLAHGTFVRPTLIELDGLADLQREVFGPVLHLVRYARPELPELIEQINATGYGLTLGLHTRIDETIAQVAEHANVGNCYVNRNMVGAVVGVQPFGGEGLSGTGPKAGGPLYLLRLLARRPVDAARAAVLGSGAPATASGETTHRRPVAEEHRAPSRPLQLHGPLPALRDWAVALGNTTLADTCERLHRNSPCGLQSTLRGPTGERNVYSTLPRERVLCLASNSDDALIQLAAVCALDTAALLPADAPLLPTHLPLAVAASIDRVLDWTSPLASFDAVLYHGDAAGLEAVAAALARRPGPIVGVTALSSGATDVPLERLVVERAFSVNTAAAGGNASLMTIG